MMNKKNNIRIEMRNEKKKVKRTNYHIKTEVRWNETNFFWIDELMTIETWHESQLPIVMMMMIMMFVMITRDVIIIQYDSAYYIYKREMMKRDREKKMQLNPNWVELRRFDPTDFTAIDSNMIDTKRFFVFIYIHSCYYSI